MLRRATLPLIKSANLHCFGSRAKPIIVCDAMISHSVWRHRRKEEKKVCKSAAIQITLSGLRKMIRPAELETRENPIETGEIPIASEAF
jgi:hypothetical protein